MSDGEIRKFFEYVKELSINGVPEDKVFIQALRMLKEGW